MKMKMIRRSAAMLTLFVLLGAASGAWAAEGTVNTSSLNLRKSANESSKAIQTLDRGDELDVILETGDWYKVRYGKYTGYVMKKYVKVTGEIKKAEENKNEEKGKEESASTVTLRKGAKGTAVKNLQRRLKELGYYSGSIDGSYGNGTYDAVKCFQRRNGLTADGVAGSKTLAALNQNPEAAEKKTATEQLSWFGNEDVIPKNAVFTVKDCLTGKTFKARRWSGVNHLDAEPVTAEDSAVMKSVYGGSWSWDRRAILVKYNGHVYAASMNGMPHGTDTISGNDFAGHFCIHFKSSRTHETNRVDGDHQNAVSTAMKYSW